MTATEKRTRLRAVLNGSTCLSPATVFDALSARVAESVGYEVAVLSGSVSGSTLLGVPDLALQTLSEFAEQVRRITRGTDLSLVLDADHGYGNALNVMRTVQELEHAGAAAMMIEDVMLPERFGATRIEVISDREMAAKLRAALAAREDAAFIIIARTAALKAEDTARAAARARAYAAEGVDALFLTGLTTLEEFDAIRAEVDLPIVVGTAPDVSREALARRGVRLLLQGHQPVAAVVKALRETYSHLYHGGAPSALSARLASAEEMASLTRTAQYDAWRGRFLR